MKGLITDLPMYLQEALEAKGVTQESYNTLKLEDVLNLYLINEGIIGYTEKILSAIDLLNSIAANDCTCYSTGKTCGSENGGFFCTREPGHDGLHVACGFSNHKLHCW